MTRIILATRPGRPAEDDIVLDHRGRSVWRAGEHARFNRQTFLVVTLLLVRSPHLVTVEEIIDHLWGNDANGGPDFPEDHIRKMKHFAVPALATIGIAVRSSWGRGYYAEVAAMPALARAA